MNDPRLTQGFERVRELTRHHAKSFYFSSFALSGHRRWAAYALYAFCRRLDDLVDGDNHGDGRVSAPKASPDELAERLQLARASVSAIYRGEEHLAGNVPWHPDELHVFHHVVERYRIPEAPFQALIDGMEMDLSTTRYTTFEQLRLYCYRVAGVVGEMMTPLLGYSSEAALPFAADLGIAMQLTNILRDVKEDWARGRVYLPSEELKHFGLTEADLAEATVDERWRALVQFNIERARAFYARSLLGLPYLDGFRSRRVVRLMATIYGHILNVIERRGYDVFAARARVSTPRKLALAVGVYLTPDSTAGAAERPLPRLEPGEPTPASALAQGAR